MDMEKAKSEFVIMSQEALEQTLNQMGDVAINTFKENIKPSIEKYKLNLIERLKNEINTTDSITVKARDYLYIFAVEFVVNLFKMIEDNLGLK